MNLPAVLYVHWLYGDVVSVEDKYLLQIETTVGALGVVCRLTLSER